MKPRDAVWSARWTSALTATTEHPAADAALDELVHKDGTDLRVRLLQAVIRAVNGYQPTQELLQKALAAAKDDQQRKRLEFALKLLEDEKE